MIELDILKLMDADPQLPALGIVAESYALEEYLKTLDERLSNIQQQTQFRLEAELRQSYPNIAADPESEYYDIIRSTVIETIPRFFVGAALVSVWAFYESAIEELADYAKRKERIGVSLKDLKGNFNDQSRKYFAYVLKLPLPYTDHAVERLSHLSILRDCFAHDNGNLRNVSEERLEKIRNITSRSDGASIVENHLVITANFVLDSYRFIEQSLQTVLDFYLDRYRKDTSA